MSRHYFLPLAETCRKAEGRASGQERQWLRRRDAGACSVARVVAHLDLNAIRTFGFCTHSPNHYRPVCTLVQKLGERPVNVGRRSCPRDWCKSGLAVLISGGFGRGCQAAATGRLTRGSSPIAAACGAKCQRLLSWQHGNLSASNTFADLFRSSGVARRGIFGSGLPRKAARKGVVTPWAVVGGRDGGRK